MTPKQAEIKLGQLRKKADELARAIIKKTNELVSVAGKVYEVAFEAGPKKKPAAKPAKKKG